MILHTLVLANRGRSESTFFTCNMSERIYMTKILNKRFLSKDIKAVYAFLIQLLQESVMGYLFSKPV